MKFVEEKDGFIIEFDDGEVNAINKTKSLYLNKDIGKSFAQNLMACAMREQVKFMLTKLNLMQRLQIQTRIQLLKILDKI